MHCPKCFNDSLRMASRGIVHITVNGMQKDNGRFLYNCEKQTTEEIGESFKAKLEEFFKWYSTFQNKDPIKVVQIVSSDFSCEEKCKLNITQKFSILDILIPYEQTEKIIKELGKIYNMEIQLNAD